MSQLTPRNIDILRIIVEEFLSTGEVLWSKALLKKYDLWVSSATVRNDMAYLESLQLIYQPYNSAGRLPTSKGLRAFVNYLMQHVPDYFLEEQNKRHDHQVGKNLNQYIHKLVFELAKNTKEISFCVIPENGICEYSGIADFIERNQKRCGQDILHVVRMLEDEVHFSDFIKKLPTTHGVNVFIGEENILPFLKDYTIVMKPILINGEVGYIGILWGLKMDYSFNISVIRGII